MKSAIEYVQLLHPEFHVDLIKSDIIIALSIIATHNRIMIESSELDGGIDEYAHAYVWNIARSGVSKSHGGRIIEHLLLKEFYKKADDRLRIAADDYLTNLRFDSLTQFDFTFSPSIILSSTLEEKKKVLYEDSDVISFLKRHDVKEWINERLPSTLTHQDSDGTAEGFHRTRLTYMYLNVGAPFVVHDELTEYLSSDNQFRKDFMVSLRSQWDSYKSDSKASLTGSRQTAKGVPGTVNLSGSVEGMNQRLKERIISTLIGGDGRRVLFTYNPEHEIKLLDKDESDKNREIAAQLWVAINESKWHEEIQLGSSFVCESDVDYYIHDYKSRCTMNSDDKDIDPVLRADWSSRWLKALKLAGLYAMYNHPVNKVITMDDYEQAVKKVEKSGTYLHRFVTFLRSNEADLEMMEVFDIIKEGDGITNEDLRGRLSSGTNKRLTGLLQRVEVHSDKKGLQFSEVVDTNNKKFYTIEEVDIKNYNEI